MATPVLPYVIHPVHWEEALAAGNFEPAISIKNLEQTEHGVLLGKGL